MGLGLGPEDAENRLCDLSLCLILCLIPPPLPYVQSKARNTSQASPAGGRRSFLRSGFLRFS